MVVGTLFVVSLATGGLGVYVGARLVLGEEDPVNAALTGLIGAVVWVVGGALVGWVPLLGQLIVLAVYAAVVYHRYPGDWVDATKVALVAWLVTFLVLLVLAAVGLATYEAVRVPFA